MTQEALKLALEALDKYGFAPCDKEEDWQGFKRAITAIKEALAQPEPVAWMDADGNVSDNNDHNCFPIPLYTTPPQEQQSCDKRTWQGLTHEQVDSWELPDCPTVFEFAQFIEAKLKEKNNG